MFCICLGTKFVTICFLIQSLGKSSCLIRTSRLPRDEVTEGCSDGPNGGLLMSIPFKIPSHPQKSFTESMAEFSPSSNQFIHPKTESVSKTRNLRTRSGSSKMDSVEDPLVDWKPQRLYKRFADKTPSSENTLRIEVSPPTDKPIRTGFSIRIRCILDIVKRPTVSTTFVLLRQPFGEHHAHPIEQATQIGPRESSSQRMEKEFSVILTEKDNRATFFCEVVSSGSQTNVMRSSGQYYNVTCEFPCLNKFKLVITNAIF
ncbi:hypothetical protein PHET_04186 [Paragonimus heterotremus]|uniref:Ig-like domain-containing protein n=1 Tax=Paragonimus heterotremus TaxID=100268 RepID=A0A8J4T9X4_9TREM|nr:hypothetical protein PHET_04186 [Paragonimus heterotremus]